MAAELAPLVDKVWRHCENSGNRGRTVRLKVKFADFEIMSRSQSFPAAVASRDELESAAVALLAKSMPLPKAVRLLGVSLSTLQPGDETSIPQLALELYGGASFDLCYTIEPLFRLYSEQQTPSARYIRAASCPRENR